MARAELFAAFFPEFIGCLAALEALMRDLALNFDERKISKAWHDKITRQETSGDEAERLDVAREPPSQIDRAKDREGEGDGDEEERRIAHNKHDEIEGAIGKIAERERSDASDDQPARCEREEIAEPSEERNET